MSFDRSKLDPFGFVLPAEESSHRGQIPRTFYRFAVACNPIKIPQKKGHNIVITGADLIAVYAVLRSKPASHRWKGETVKAELQTEVLGMGGNKVEAILSFLNKEGWIRYVDLPNDGGRRGGSIIEVQYRRLHKNEAGKRRRIRSVQGRGAVMFEEDGKTEVEDAKSRRKFITADVDKDRPYGRDDEDNERNWQPYTRRSGERLPEERLSREPEPKERSAGDEYKDHLDKDHIVEDTPIVPQAEPGESDSFGSVGQQGERRTCDSVTAGNDTVVNESDSSPGETFGIMKLVTELERLGKAASQSPEDRNRYELFLAREVSPRLKDSQIPERCTASVARKWAEQSLKAQIVLALVADDSWPDDLLRRFLKHDGTYSASEVLTLLLNINWDSKRSTSLHDLILDGKRQWNPNGWSKFKNKVCGENSKMLASTRLAIDMLVLEGRESDCSLASEWIKEKESEADPFLIGSPNTNQVFEWLFQVWHAGSANTADSFEGAFTDVRDRYREDIMSFVSCSRQHLAVASSQHSAAGEIWGIDWDQVREIHRNEIEALNLRAQIFGIDPVAPLFDLIDRPLGGQLSSAPIEIRTAAPPEPDVQEPDFCSPACVPFSRTNSLDNSQSPRNPTADEFSKEKLVEGYSKLLNDGV